MVGAGAQHLSATAVAGRHSVMGARTGVTAIVRQAGVRGLWMLSRRVDGLPMAARKVARSVGRDDVELRITGTEDGPRAVVLDAAGTTVQLMDHLPAPRRSAI
jgi:hypothetical protein